MQPETNQPILVLLSKFRSSGTHQSRFLIPGVWRFKGFMQPESFARGVGSYGVSIGISLGHQLLTAGVNKKANKIGTAVVTTVVMNGFRDVRFVKVNLCTLSVIYGHGGPVKSGTVGLEECLHRPSTDHQSPCWTWQHTFHQGRRCGPIHCNARGWSQVPYRAGCF